MAATTDSSLEADTTSTLESQTAAMSLEDDEEWELEEGIPQFSDPFIQKC